MKSKEFLKDKLSDLSIIYPATIIKYYFDTFDNDHFVCIYPNADLREIIEKQATIIDRQFINSFPTESLSFIDIEDALTFDELVAEFYPIISSKFTTINFEINDVVTADNYFESSFYNANFSNPYKIEDLATSAVAGSHEFALAA